MNNTWISVRNRLPEKEGSYLTFVRFRDGSTQQKIKLFKYGSFTSEAKAVTHWRELPPDPEEE